MLWGLRYTAATTNKVIDIGKVVLREELDRDSTGLVRRVHYKKRECGLFTIEELKRLFPDYGYGPWKDARDYTCFFLAAVKGGIKICFHTITNLSKDLNIRY